MSKPLNGALAFTIDTEWDYWGASHSHGITRGVPKLLDFLRALEIRATFFWTGRSAAAHEGVVQQVISEGHEIACHGLDHENFTLLSRSDQHTAIRTALSLLQGVGADCVGFRAPRLRVNDDLFETLIRLGFAYDSSIPFWGLRRYKYGHRYDNPGLVELKCIPSYAFRMTPALLTNALERSCRALGYAVFFIHPWEIVEVPADAPPIDIVRRCNLLNTWHIGPRLLERLYDYFRSIRSAYRMEVCRNIAEEVRLER